MHQIKNKTKQKNHKIFNIMVSKQEYLFQKTKFVMFFILMLLWKCLL